MVAKRKPSPAVKKLTSKNAAPAKKKAAKKSVVVASKAAKKPLPAGRATAKKAAKPNPKERTRLVKEKAKPTAQKSGTTPKKPVPKKTTAAKTTAKSKSAPKKAVSVKAPETKKPVPRKATAKTAAPKKAAPKKATPKKAAQKKVAPAKTVAKKATLKKSVAKAATKQPVKKASAQKKPAAKATAGTSATAKVTKAATPKASARPKAKPKTAKRTTGNAGSDSTASFTPYVLKRNEAFMNETQRAHFKSILLNWRNELMEEVDRTVSHMKNEAANYPDPSDRASQEEEFSLELRTRDRERKLIRKIEKTIDLIDQDDYGYCDTCGVEIGIRRLEARPTANQCIDCKTLDELKERQLHG